MAILRIKNNVKIGGVYECSFGSFKKLLEHGGGVTNQRGEADESDHNYRIPNELIKKRPVIVISKHRGLCTVVPVSGTKELNTKPGKVPETMGIHVQLQGHIPTTHRYEDKPCWGLCNLAHTIDSGRLRDIYDENTKGFIVSAVSQEMLIKLRFGVMRSIGMGSLIPLSEEERINGVLTPEKEVEGIDVTGQDA